MTEFDPREPEEVDDALTGGPLAYFEELSGIAVERMTVLAEREVHLRLTGRNLRAYKVYDHKSGRSAAVVLDPEDRREDGDRLMEAEAEAEKERYGNLQHELLDVVERQSETDPEGRIPVVVKYVIEDDEARFDKREIDVVDDETIEAMAGRSREYEQRRRDQVVELHRGTMREVGDEVDEELPSSGPFVRAELTPDALRRLSRDERIAFIGIHGEPDVLDYPTIPESLPTTRADTVHTIGATGNNVRIAVLEYGALSESQACFNIAAIQDNTVSASSHMTKSVAIIGNRYNNGACNGGWEGYAPDAAVYLANTDDYPDRYDWARDRGVNVVTMSWHKGSEETSGGLHSRDVYFDYWVLRWPYPSVFTSAGNEAEEDAFASGKGFNFFGVGNVLNDGDGDRCNDVISSSSSWKDPTSTHGDREIPEIASPGSRHDLLGDSFGGTSCATPVTASIAALLMDHNSSLKIWPEAIRAILLATANYQEADSLDWRTWRDGKDGTGLTNALYGAWTAGRRETGSTAQYRAHDYGQMTDDDFQGGYFEKTWKAKTGTTSSRIRVALTWNSKVWSFIGIPIASYLDADLDLWLFDPDGILVASSSSWDSNYEFIEHTPSKVGEYEIRVRGWSVPDDFSSWYGVAWTTHYDLC